MSLEICNIVVNKLHQLGDALVIEDTYTDSLLKFCQYCKIFPNILIFEENIARGTTDPEIDSVTWNYI